MTISDYGQPDSHVSWTQELEALRDRVFDSEYVTAYPSQVLLIKAMKNAWPQLNARTELKLHIELRRVTVCSPVHVDVEKTEESPKSDGPPSLDPYGYRALIDTIRDHIEEDTLYNVWRDLFSRQWPGFTLDTRPLSKPSLHQSCANAFIKKYSGATDTFNFDRLTTSVMRDLDILPFKVEASMDCTYIYAAYNPTDDKLHYMFRYDALPTV